MNLEAIKKIIFKTNEPYPEITNETFVEKEILPLLINSYAGIKSETTSVFQYSYQSSLFKANNKDLHEILEKVSIQEMIHAEILSQLLLAQKIDPKFCRYIDNNFNICESWSANSINYEKDIVRFLNYNIDLENSAISTYKKIVQSSSSDNIKDIINRIIADEELHIKVFGELIDIYK